MTSVYERVICNFIFATAHCTIAKMRNQPRHPWTDDKTLKRDTYTLQNTTLP